MEKFLLTYAFCTYKRPERLEKLVAAMRAQECPVPFEILAINNNSPDNTLDILEKLAHQPGAPLRYVTETQQGIVPARNRALSEAKNSEVLVFIDDDELPHPGSLTATWDAIANENADCVGGRVLIDFTPFGRPVWLGDDLLGFLAHIDYGNERFWVRDDTTPLWTSNIAYRMAYIREKNLRFDSRYNRRGASASDFGGGEDAVMFRRQLELNARIRYRPDMSVDHSVDSWRLERRYFLRLHYLAGKRKGLYELPTYPKTIFGVPPFLVVQFLRHSLRSLYMHLVNNPSALRQSMNAAHSLGNILGYAKRSDILKNNTS